MRILITNDDGIHAEGLFALKEVASEFGDVVVVAPDRERSACGHSMTVHEPLRVREVSWHACRAYEVNGLPVDCVNVGLTIAHSEGCDLVLSGINHGANLGYDITYSGTIGGAMEGAINGIRSIAVSMDSYTERSSFHLETAQQWLRENWRWLTETPLAPGALLNVNVPAIPYAELKGNRVVSMGHRIYADRVEERADPWGRPYFWQGGVPISGAEQPGTDYDAVKNGYVSITPISLDWTHQDQLTELRASQENQSPNAVKE